MMKKARSQLASRTTAESPGRRCVVLADLGLKPDCRQSVVSDDSEGHDMHCQVSLQDKIGNDNSGQFY